MKKILFVLTAFLLLNIFCSDYSKLNLDYSAEKQFYKANKLKSRLLINPMAASEGDYDEVAASFRKIISRYKSEPENSDIIQNIVDRSWLSIAAIYVLKQDFDSTLQIYDEILRLNPANESLCASARYSKALTFESLNKPNCALVEYKIFFADHEKFLKDLTPKNLKYLETPLKIARLHSRINKKTNKLQYDIARDFYFDLSCGQIDKQVVSSIYHLLALTYSDTEDWEKTTNILHSLITDYPDSSREPFICFEIANITANRLDQKSEAVEIYKKTLEKYPDHSLSAHMNLNIGDIYFKDRLYENARTFYKKILSNYPGNISVCSRALFGIGLTFEKSGEWEKAVNEFDWVWDNYPLSNEAMVVPTYIAKYYQKNNMKKLAQKSFEAAIRKYDSFYLKYSKSELVPISLFQKAVAYENLEKWQEAIKTLELILSNFSDANIIPEVYLHLSSIYNVGLEQKDQALQFYQLFYNRFPGHPAADQVEKKINQLIKS